MASWYDRFVVPRMIRCACGSAMIARYRQQVVPQAHGAVLELGIGAGANLAFYDPDRVMGLTGLEPSAELRAMAQRATRPAGLAVTLVSGEGEALPFPSESFDTVVCTYTLCSVHDPAAVLAEAWRVLRPGGELRFAEHGRAPEAGVARWQRRIEPVWKPLAGGCHLTREVHRAVETQFGATQWQGGYSPGAPRVFGWMEWGVARR
jgi:ubiquinone/menaquinone biosynthesis C-methylase UbiE